MHLVGGRALALDLELDLEILHTAFYFPPPTGGIEAP